MKRNISLGDEFGTLEAKLTFTISYYILPHKISLALMHERLRAFSDGVLGEDLNSLLVIHL